MSHLDWKSVSSLDSSARMGGVTAVSDDEGRGLLAGMNVKEINCHIFKLMTMTYGALQGTTLQNENKGFSSYLSRNSSNQLLQELGT